MVVRGLEWTLWSFLISLGDPGGSSLKTLGLLSSVLDLKIPKLEARSFHSELTVSSTFAKGCKYCDYI